MDTRTRKPLLFSCALLLTGIQGCATLESSEEEIFQRAYERRVEVTGTRIRARLDEKGQPKVGYRVETLRGDELQAFLRTLQQYPPR